MWVLGSDMATLIAIVMPCYKDLGKRSVAMLTNFPYPPFLLDKTKMTKILYL